jgi:hypothetical protein
MLGSAAAVVVLAASSYVITADAGKDEVATGSLQAVVDSALGFDWTVSDDGLSYPESWSAGPSGLYAISTAPGTKSEDFPQGAPKAMYRLTDEGTWAPIALEGDDPQLGRISQRGDTLYALSTGTVGSQDGNPIGSISTDGGESWSSVPLEPATPPSDAVPWHLYYSLDVASTADRTVAVVTASVAVPYESLFPELLNNEAGHLTVTTTDEGVNLVRMPEKELRVGADGSPSDPEADVALNPEDADAAKREQADRAPSSTSPPEVPSPTTGPGNDGPVGEVLRSRTWAELGITGEADLAPQRWAYVADGNEWTEVEAPTSATPSTYDSMSLEATDDSFVLTVSEMADDGTGRLASYRSADGQNWESLQTPGADGRLLAVGGSLVYVAYSLEETSVQVSSDGGASWSQLDLAALDPALADLSPGSLVQATSGPLGIALIITDEDAKSPRLLFSSDLQRWSLTHLDDVAPDGAYFGEVVVGTDRIVVPGHRDVGELGSPERSTTLTGVPRRS